MKRSQRLTIVLELAQRKEDAALKHLRQAQTQLQQQQEQLDQLIQYQTEYHQQIRQSSQVALSASSYQSSQHFLSQLGAAIVQQQSKVEFCQSEFEAYRGQWQQLHQKKKGMDDFIVQCQQVEQAQVDKREQKEMDEMSGQRAARNRTP